MKTTEIKIGEIFTVESHMYIIGKPKLQRGARYTGNSILMVMFPD